MTGQKVWTSRGAYAHAGFLLARSDPDVPKHVGITAFAVDMRSAGVEVRPLRQMNGDAHFSEVFLDDVLVPDQDRVGEPGHGWSVARTGLANERGALGARSSAGTGRPRRDGSLRCSATRRAYDPCCGRRVAATYTATPRWPA